MRYRIRLLNAVAALSVVLLIAAVVSRKSTVSVGLRSDKTGLRSVTVDDVDILRFGGFNVDDVQLLGKDGVPRAASGASSNSFDPNEQTATYEYPWGSIKVQYAAANSQLTLRITTTNKSASDTIQSVRYTPLSLKFPQAVNEYDGSTPLLEHNIDRIGYAAITFGNYLIVVSCDDVDKPLMVGFPWALDRPSNTEFPLSVHTGRVKNFPDSLPAINRPIPPGQTDTFTVSLRFGRKGDDPTAALADLNERFLRAFPAELNWTDHRPIGAIFLATPPRNLMNNPRGWFGDPNFSSLTAPAAFRQRLLEVAEGAIRIMREMDAQGAITWDLEGQQFFAEAGYAADPRALDQLAPEMAAVADDYFRKFTEAGLLAGISVRPQQLVLSEDRKTLRQVPVEDPTELLAAKIRYARNRWGIRLVMIVANANASDPNPIGASVIQTLAQRFPDVLLIPEHSSLRYHAYSAPYQELRRGRIGTPPPAAAIYKNAFSVIYTADGALDSYRNELRKSVQRGDIAMYRTWFQDPQNQKVRMLYGQ